MIKRILFLVMFLFSHLSVSAGITDLKLSTAQIFDVQWYISGGKLNASGFNYIYSSVNYATQTTSAARWTLAQTQDASANGRYIGFFNSTTNPGTYGMAVFNSNGTVYKIINNTGSFRALADGAIFYNGNGMWGTLITTGQGYNNGQSGSWNVTQDYPTTTQLEAYTPPSSTPLAAGQTAQSSTPATPTVTGTSTSYTYRTVVNGNVTKVYRTPVTTTTYSDNSTTTSNGTEALYYTATATITDVSSSNTQQGVVTTTTTRTDTVMFDGSQSSSYSQSSVTTPWPNYVTIGNGNVSNNIVINTVSNITAPHQAKVDAWAAKTVTDGNQIYIDQVYGDNNIVTIDQHGNKNLITATFNGYNNNIKANQGVPGIGQNEMKLNFEGNNNVVNLNQARDTSGNPLGTNGHYLDATIAGWGTNLTVQQTNAGGVGGHYNETTITGNGNNVLTKQTDNGNKIMFVKIDGALNTVDAQQKGTGQHRLEATLTGDFNSATVLQEGSIANNATLNLTNAGGPANVIVNQTGGQSVSVTTSCATAGGCAPITVRQGY